MKYEMIFHRIVSNLLVCLALTVVLEAAAAFVCGVRTRFGQLVVLLANVVTNPVMNCALTVVSFYISPRAYYYFLVPLEVIVVQAEGLIYKQVLRSKMNPFLLSFLLNACSYGLGTLILKLIKL